MRLPFEIFLALRYLRYHRGRTFLSVITLISVAGVAVGTAALVIALAMMAGTLEDVRQRIHSGSAHLTVMSADSAVFDGVEPVLERVVDQPGVSAAAAVLYTPGMLINEAVGEPGYAEIHGVEPAAHARVILDERGEDDPFAALSEPTTSGRAPIVVGEELASRIGAIPGSLVRVLVPRVRLSPWGASPRMRVFEVVGSYRSDHFQEDSRRAYVHIDGARRLLGEAAAASWVEVRLDDLGALAELKIALRDRLGEAWLVVDLIEQNRELFRALETEKVTLFLAIGLIVVVAALNIVSTLILMVHDKIKEIGTLSAMGARASGIAAVFILQGFVIGVVGTVTGLALGASVSVWLDRYQVIRLNPEVYFFSHVPFLVQPLDLVSIGAAALVISLLATLYPALRAAGLDPVEAIRYE